MRNSGKTLWSFALGMLLIPTWLQAQAFAYLGDRGPAFWDLLNPAWASCHAGRQQSPVDFQGEVPVRQWQLTTDYQMSRGEIFNNGHTIEVEVEGENNVILSGVDYRLLQFHFHVASEHRINGGGFDMEMHLVHQSAAGNLAVIGVLLQRGTSSAGLAPIFANLPAADSPVNVKVALPDSFNPMDFLPKSGDFYEYSGSLTTPPCSEGVRWVVMAQPLTISDEDLAQFAARISFNARYVQRVLN